MAEVEVLTREKALPQNILPTGRQLGVAHVRGVGMYEVKYVDGKQGDLPDVYKSKFTGVMAAERSLKKIVEDFWNMSDRASKKKN